MARKFNLRRACAALKPFPATVLFFAFLFGMMAADWLLPDRASSELENKTLQQRPTLSLSALFSDKGAKTLNTFFTRESKYVKEQFTGRDVWIDLQSRCETQLFCKTENGGMLLGAEGMEFPRTYGLLASEQTTLPKNIAALQALGARYGARVSLMLVPSAASVYPQDVPAHAPLYDENARIDDAEAQIAASGVSILDIRSTLAAHSAEYLYYRTDHHWTADGAYYAYAAYCAQQGLTPLDRSTLTAHTVPDFYGTHYSASRYWRAEPDTITWYDFDSTLTVYKVTAADAAEPVQTTGLYDESKFAVRDKYAAFLYGNNGYSRLTGSGTGSVLVVKDSFANSMVPYLTANYATVDVVDLRDYGFGLDALIAKNDYDSILVLYSYASFKSDTNLYKAGIAG